jgi:hypothetical protein
MLEDGYQSLITFASNPTVSLWEKAVKPPGVDGGEAIDITTMHNVEWRTMASRALKTLTQSTTRCAYAPEVHTDLVDLINLETTITVLFPNGDRLAFYGFLQSVEFDDLVEGTHPECTVTFTPTNRDPSTKTEEDPVFDAA